MQIIQRSSSKHFDISPDTALSVEYQNPYFQNAGSFSLPLTLPDTYNNRLLLGYANRLDVATQAANGSLTRQIPSQQQVLVVVNSWQQVGTMHLLSYSENGFECTIFFVESAIFEKLKEVTLKDIMHDIVWDSTTGRTTRLNAVPIAPEALVDILEERINGTVNISDNDDWVVFPLMVGNLGIINHVTPGRYNRGVFPQRSIFIINDKFTVFRKTNGIGYTAFLRLSTILELVFAYLGKNLTIEYPTQLIDGLSFEDVFKKIVILNSTIDACAPGVLFYQTLVPDMPVLDFLQNMFVMFSAGIFEDPDGTVRMRFMNQLIENTAPEYLNSFVSNIQYQNDTYLQIAFNHLRGDSDKDITDISNISPNYLMPDDELKTDSDENEADNLIHDQPKIARDDAMFNELVRIHDRGYIAIKTEAPGTDEFYAEVAKDQLNLIAPPNTDTEDLDNSISDTKLAPVFEFIKAQDPRIPSGIFTEAYDIYTPWLPELNSETTAIAIRVTTIAADGTETATVTTIPKLSQQPLVFCYYGQPKAFYTYNKNTHQDGFIYSAYATPYYIFDTNLADHQHLDLTATGMPKTMHQPYQQALHEGMHTITAYAALSTNEVLNFKFHKPILIHSRKYMVRAIKIQFADQPLQQVELTLMAI